MKFYRLIPNIKEEHTSIALKLFHKIGILSNPFLKSQYYPIKPNKELKEKGQNQVIS